VLGGAEAGYVEAIESDNAGLARECVCRRDEPLTHLELLA
jgi:hypothetical protein